MITYFKVKLSLLSFLNDIRWRKIPFLQDHSATCSATIIMTAVSTTFLKKRKVTVQHIPKKRTSRKKSAHLQNM